ncbi:MAG: ABC transporter substrate-binding protein, partial [Thermoanaerobaculia bacterium]|nr:ABC transporter substrate-binding protein [Thermoanaerobaculia bacterium]
MKKTSALIAALLAAASFPALAQQKEFKVGIPLPLTGAEAKFGEMKKIAYEMAAEEINARAGAKGTKLVFDIQDSGAKQDTSAAIVEKFITVNKYPMIAGEYSS